MVGLDRKGEKELECPFCRKGKVKTFYKEGYMQARTSRISGRQETRSHQIPETHDVLGDCPHCGARKRDIQDYYEGKYKKKISHEERLKLWKKKGLPLLLGR